VSKKRVKEVEVGLGLKRKVEKEKRERKVEEFRKKGELER
jgi:hypothetical protein